MLLKTRPRRYLPAAIALLMVFGMIPANDPQAAGKKEMEKYVSEQANFVLYKPKGWTVGEEARQGYRTLTVSDPGGLYQAAMYYGSSPVGDDVTGVARYFAREAGQKFREFHVRNAMISRDKTKIVFDAGWKDPKKGQRESRWWISLREGEFTLTRIEATEGHLSEKRQLLLTVLSNVRVTRGAFAKAPGGKVPLRDHRLRDGSASFRAPGDWKVQDLGKGQFVATDASGLSSFIVGSTEAITPQMGTRVPGVLVSPFLPPHRAMKFFTAQQGLLSDMRFLQVKPRRDISQQISRVFTAGPVEAEEFVYTFTTKGKRCKAFTFGICFGSRLGINWRFWHISGGGPVETFDSFAPVLAEMMQSYRIDDKFARDYVAKGTARLRQMQRQTAEMVARNRQEISQMMQAAYDERQKSMDYIDYQRTTYIRGQQDWISEMEGGTVYHTDSWGTKNTATEEYWEGKAYDYVHFKGKNPKYNEQMTPIDNRQLYETHIKGK